MDEKITVNKLSDLSEKEIKELEAKLKKCAAKIDPGDFEEHYQAIRESLPPKQKPRLRPSFWRFFVPVISSLCTGGIVLGIMLPMVMNSRTSEDDHDYFLNQLRIQDTETSEFFGAIGEAGIVYNEPSDMTARDYKVFVTQKNKVLGGSAEYYAGEVSDYYLMVKVFNRRVKIYSDPLVDYNLTYEKNGASVKYSMTEITDPDSPDIAYDYTAFGTYKTQTYTIEYTSMQEDITDVFDELFI